MDKNYVETFDKMVKIQKEFAPLYQCDGVIAVSESYVHITSDAFMKAFGTMIVAEPHGTDGVKLLLTTMYRGVKFIALVDVGKYPGPVKV